MSGDLEKLETNAMNFGSSRVIVDEIDVNNKLIAQFDIDRSAVSKKTYSSSSFYSIQSLINIFLPTGYPHSVSTDYIDYQIYDSIQAFSSSIASLFANRAVLSAVGVGDETASSTSALFMKVVQETVGRLGTIGFAWRFGSALEPECKKYRFMADIVNDSAILFDMVSPLFPTSRANRLVMLCMSGLLRSVCGVMAGASRTALTQHFTDPIRGSIADVNAKDQSQETVISLMGMLAGSLIVGMVHDEGSTSWLVVIFFLIIHLWTNYKAVSSVVMLSINRQRANILFSDIVRSLQDFERIVSIDIHPVNALSKLFLSPRLVSERERILEPDGLLRWHNGDVIGHATFAGFSEITAIIGANSISALLEACQTPSSGYVLWYSVANNKPNLLICLVETDDRMQSENDLKAWVHALLIAQALRSTPAVDPISIIIETRHVLNKVFRTDLPEALALAGWDSDRYAVQTLPQPIIRIRNFDEKDLID